MPEPEIELCPECKSVMEKHSTCGKKSHVRFHCPKENCIVSFKEFRGKGKNKSERVVYAIPERK